MKINNEKLDTLMPIIAGITLAGCIFTVTLTCMYAAPLSEEQKKEQRTAAAKQESIWRRELYLKEVYEECLNEHSLVTKEYEEAINDAEEIKNICDQILPRTERQIQRAQNRCDDIDDYISNARANLKKSLNNKLAECKERKEKREKLFDEL